jgi:hypothetical protein
MQEYKHKKNGYSLNAVRLIYGSRSPHAEQFSMYSMPPHDSHRVQYHELENAREPSLGPGINTCTRMVSFGDGRSLTSTITQGTGINTAIVYRELLIDPGEYSKQFTDSLFSQPEYEYFERHWDDQVQYKVNILAKLIQALDTGDDTIYPILVADFPEISRYLLSKPSIITQRSPIWP